MSPETATNALRARARARHEEAQRVLTELELLERWSAYGEPVVVGSVALDLVVRRDIDLEIYADSPTVGAGFAVASALAEQPHVRAIRYRDCRDETVGGLYWCLEYWLTADHIWTVDMWFFSADRRTVCGAPAIPAIRAALRPADRDHIVAIKEDARTRGERAHGHWLYRAVLNHGVRTYDEYRAWLGDQHVWERTAWRPRSPR